MQHVPLIAALILYAWAYLHAQVYGNTIYYTHCTRQEFVSKGFANDRDRTAFLAKAGYMVVAANVCVALTDFALVGLSGWWKLAICPALFVASLVMIAWCQRAGMRAARLGELYRIEKSLRATGMSYQDAEHEALQSIELAETPYIWVRIGKPRRG